MSDENNETTEKKQKKVREPKKGSILAADAKALVEGLPQYEKASFLIVGHKSGTRIALPLTSGISRTYFYGDYTLIPSDPAIKVFTAEQRKEERRGGITAEVDYSQGPEAAKQALAKLVEVVRNAPTPSDKPKRVKKEKPVKAAAVPVAEGSSDRDDVAGNPVNSDDSSDEAQVS